MQIITSKLFEKVSLLLCIVLAFLVITSCDSNNVEQNLYDFTNSNDISSLQHLLEDNYLLANTIFHDKLNQPSLLIMAVTKGNLEIVNLLLNNGANPLTPDWTGQNSLHVAAFENEVGIVKILIEYGVDANIRSQPRNSPPKTISMAYSLTPLMLAAVRNNHKVVSLLINKGADVNLKDNSGRTALLYSVSSVGKGLESFEILLNHGANTAVVDNDGNTLHDWAKNKRGRVKEILTRLDSLP